MASQLDPLVVCVPGDDPEVAQDWRVIDGIRSDAHAYLVGRLQRETEVRVGSGIDLDLDACHGIYWRAALTAREIAPLLHRISASPDTAGRDVDAAYRAAVTEHRRLLGDLSATVAAMRAEQELANAQDRRVDSVASWLPDERLSRSLAKRKALAELYDLEPPQEVDVPVAPVIPLTPTDAAPNSTPSAARASRQPRRKSSGPESILEVRPLRGTAPARRLDTRAGGAQFTAVRVPPGHFVVAQREGAWVVLKGRKAPSTPVAVKLVLEDGEDLAETSLDAPRDTLVRLAGAGPYWLVDSGWTKRARWTDESGAGERFRGSAELRIVDCAALVAALAGGLDKASFVGLVRAALLEALERGPELESGATGPGDPRAESEFDAAVTEAETAANAKLRKMGVGVETLRASAIPESASERRLREQVDQGLAQLEQRVGMPVSVPRRLRGPVLELAASLLRMFSAQLPAEDGVADIEAIQAAAHRYSELAASPDVAQALVDQKMLDHWVTWSGEVSEAVGNAHLRRHATVTARQAADTNPGDGRGVHAPGPNADRGPRERLRQLTDLLQSGLITQAEFEARRNSVLDSI
jgi:hypothetical protein